MITTLLTDMFQAYTRQKQASKALDVQVLKIKALRLREVEPKEVPLDLETNNFWDRLSSELGHGVMFARTSFQTEDEAAISCHWEEGAMMHPICHPEADKYIYVIRGALRDLISGALLQPGEKISLDDIINGTAHAQPYLIPAGQAHFLQSLEPDTFFVIKFKSHEYANNR
jgi:hypothetical protein